MKVRFLKPAQSELDDAFAWYDSQSSGPETQFLDNIDRTIRRIAAYPLSRVEIEQDLRQLTLSDDGVYNMVQAIWRIIYEIYKHT